MTFEDFCQQVSALNSEWISEEIILNPLHIISLWFL